MLDWVNAIILTYAHTVILRVLLLFDRGRSTLPERKSIMSSTFKYTKFDCYVTARSELRRCERRWGLLEVPRGLLHGAEACLLRPLHERVRVGPVHVGLLEQREIRLLEFFRPERATKKKW